MYHAKYHHQHDNCELLIFYLLPSHSISRFIVLVVPIFLIANPLCPPPFSQLTQLTPALPDHRHSNHNPDLRGSRPQLLRCLQTKQRHNFRQRRRAHLPNLLQRPIPPIRPSQQHPRRCSMLRGMLNTSDEWSVCGVPQVSGWSVLFCHEEQWAGL